MSKRILLACAVLCGSQQLQAEVAKNQAVATTAEQSPATTVDGSANKAKVESEVLYVDMQQAMLQSKQGAEAQKIVEAEEKKYAEMAQKAQQDMIKVKTELDQKASMMSPEARRTQEKKLGDMQRNFQTNMNDWREELQFTMQRETDAMIKDIELSAKELGLKNGKKPVIDAQTGRALYLPDDMNSTNQLITVMDQNYDAKKKTKTVA